MFHVHMKQRELWYTTPTLIEMKRKAAVILNVSYCQIIQWKDQTSSALVPLSTSWLACLVWDEAHKQETAGHVRFWQLLGNRVLFGTIFSGGLIHIPSSEYTFILFRLWKNMSVSATVWFRLCVFEQQCGSFSQGNIIFGLSVGFGLFIVFSVLLVECWQNYRRFNRYILGIMLLNYRARLV